MISEAKAALLRAHDELEQAEAELGGAGRVDLVVVYAVGREGDEDWHEVSGWACTPGPKWMHVALLRRAADAQDEVALAVDTEDEEED